MNKNTIIACWMIFTFYDYGMNKNHRPRCCHKEEYTTLLKALLNVNLTHDWHMNAHYIILLNVHKWFQ